MGAHLLGIPLAFFFCALAWMLERSRRVSPLDAWILFLAGFYLNGTGLGNFLSETVNAVMTAIGGK
ncbi:hypothetical protein KDK95_01425 [Actinospica sp. MGRD01-02]|uniref:Uncharacterized protein n=1 Tax=Actinospica acidithermotolerans TaxID=2828514 RepID=A0A941E7N6_9ACTN|nr:hypothetical protein [Actinospica acidithermotolerans]MBR7824950.1 hypothetical protein [Actinospica acidithermotolerans]